MTETKTQVMEVTGNQGIRLLAIDLGASSGRVLLGSYRDGKVTVEEIHRFPNGPVEVNGHLHWDVQRLLEEIKQGIAAAAASYGPLHSLSVDTWGVDYGLLDEQGGLLYAPHHYRDQRMADIASALEAALPPAEQFKLTGNQSSPINTVYQLFADLMANPELRTTARQLLMMPDLFHYMLSGVAVAEQTIWSTSGLLNLQSTAPAAEVLRRLELPETLIPRLVPAGTVLGELRPALQQELGSGPLKIIAGASHDTASAVASIPYGGFGSSYAESSNADSRCADPGISDPDRIDGFSDPLPSAAFISCGTWSLVGLETAEPVLSDAARASGFTNESCFGGTNRLLKNITGLWLLQETQRCWAEAGNRSAIRKPPSWPGSWTGPRRASPCWTRMIRSSAHRAICRCGLNPTASAPDSRCRRPGRRSSARFWRVWPGLMRIRSASWRRSPAVRCAAFTWSAAAFRTSCCAN